MKRDYTGKFQVDQTVYMNDPRCLNHGVRGVVTGLAVDSRHGNPYIVRFGCYDHDLYFTEAQLSAEPILKQSTKRETKITLRIGTTGIGGGVDEKHVFTTVEEFRAFLSSRVSWLNDSHYDEILASPDTQFEQNEMIAAPTGDAAYWGAHRYEIEVSHA